MNRMMKTVAAALSLALSLAPVQAAAAPSCDDLIAAARAGDGPLAAGLIAQGVDVDCEAGDAGGGTALGWIINTWKDRKDTNAVRLLLRLGADPNKFNGFYTPLSLAIYQKNVEIAKALLADPRTGVNLKAPAGYSPLHSVLLGCGNDKSDELLDLLIKAHVDIAPLDEHGDNVAVNAASCGRAAMAQRLRGLGLTLRAARVARLASLLRNATEKHLIERLGERDRGRHHQIVPGEGAAQGWELK